MSDARLRELERTWRASGSATDEAAFLSESVRLGRLAPIRLAFAAALGHAPAAEVAPDQLQLRRENPWWYVPYGFGRRLASGEGSSLFAGPAWPSLERLQDEHRDLRPHGISMVWGPPGHEAFIRAALVLFDRVPEEAGRIRPEIGLREVLRVEEAVADDLYPAAWGFGAVRELPLRAGDFAGSGASWSRHLTQLIARLGDDAARALVVADLVPWALGYSDPLRDRVEARRNS